MNPHFEILLVEDNPGDVLLTKEAFREGGFKHRLSTVQDGEEALLFLKKLPPFENAPRPDVVLLDLNMPRKDGRELLADVKSDPSLMLIPIIVLTTSEADQDIRNAYLLHANCYLTKPIQVNAFLEKMNSVEEFWLNIVRLPTR
jgi:two-component system, chemotaxis family, response regulator Rcp1